MSVKVKGDKISKEEAAEYLNNEFSFEKNKITEHAGINDSGDIELVKSNFDTMKQYVLKTKININNITIKSIETGTKAFNDPKNQKYFDLDFNNLFYKYPKNDGKSKMFDIIFDKLKLENLFQFDEIKNEPDKSVIAIPFSGGYDSYFLTIRALRKGYKVLPVINEYNETFKSSANCYMFMKMYILSKLSKIYKYKIFEPLYNISSHLNKSGNPGYYVYEGYTQQPQTALGIVLPDRNLARKIKEFQIGFIGTDPESQWIPEMKNLHKAFFKFSNAYMKDIFEDDGFNSYYPLTFPALKFQKSEIIEYCSKYSPISIYDLPLITCEKPEFEFYMSEEYPTNFQGNRIEDKRKRYLNIYAKNCCSCPSCKEIKLIPMGGLNRMIKIELENDDLIEENISKFLVSEYLGKEKTKQLEKEGYFNSGKN